jgi:flagellar protein FliO/FliZ
MHTLAALALSIASATSPAIADPGAGPIAVSAPAVATTQSSNAAPAAPVGSAADALNNNLLGSAHASPQIVGTPTVGTQIDSAPHGFSAGSMIPVLGFALCCAAAMVFAKKKQIATPKLLEIVETHAVGGRRQIIVARIAGETVILGSSEAGLTLLLARPGETVAQLQATQDVAAAPAQKPAPKVEEKATSWLGKLRLAKAPELSFEDLLAQDAALRAQGKGQPVQMAEPALLRQPIDPLAESAEDTELRRKLAAGRSGRIA